MKPSSLTSLAYCCFACEAGVRTQTVCMLSFQGLLRNKPCMRALLYSLTMVIMLRMPQSGKVVHESRYNRQEVRLCCVQSPSVRTPMTPWTKVQRCVALEKP